MPLRFAPLPDQAYLLECLDYDPETGEFRWRHRPRHHFPSDRCWNSTNRRLAGKPAGYVHHPGGRAVVYIDLGRKMFGAHRLAFKMMTGTDPSGDIDHINRQPTDNRWVNLRAATRAQNTRNVGLRRDNLAGLKGVYFHKSKQKFVAKIRLNNKSCWLGCYATKEDAHEAYLAAARRHFGEFFCAG